MNEVISPSENIITPKECGEGTLEESIQAEKTAVRDFSTGPEAISISDGKSYYQKSILTILASVREVYGNILLTEELDLLRLIEEELPMDAQRLLFRIYLRKSGWLRRNKLEYQDVQDKDGSLQVLTEKTVLECSPTDPKEIVDMLQLDELRLLAKDLKVKTSGKTV